MSLFEWLGESWNPGSIGSLSFGKDDKPRRPRALVIVRFIFAAGLLGGSYALLIYYRVLNSGAAWTVALFITFVYLLIGYFVHPEPDMENVGWLGGFMDHPFRYSDDINRFLIFLWIFLLPGRFVAESLVEMLAMIFSGGGKRVKRKKKKRRREWNEAESYDDPDKVY